MAASVWLGRCIAIEADASRCPRPATPLGYCPVHTIPPLVRRQAIATQIADAARRADRRKHGRPEPRS